MRMIIAEAAAKNPEIVQKFANIWDRLEDHLVCIVLILIAITLLFFLIIFFCLSKKNREEILKSPKSNHFAHSSEDYKENTKDILIMQWNKLSDQVEAINSGHWKVFSIMIAALGLSSLSDNDVLGLPPFIILLPVLAMIVIVYEAYRINELAIAEGYLSKIEEVLNEIAANKESPEDTPSNKKIPPLLDPPAQWYSRYFIKYSSGKNKVKKYVYIPIGIAIFFINFICVSHLFTTPEKPLDDKTKAVYVIYLIFCFITFIIDLVALGYIKECEKTKGDVRYAKLETEDFEYLWLQDKHKSTGVQENTDKKDQEDKNNQDNNSSLKQPDC